MKVFIFQIVLPLPVPKRISNSGDLRTPSSQDETMKLQELPDLIETTPHNELDDSQKRST